MLDVVDIRNEKQILLDKRDKAVEQFIVARSTAVKWQKEIERLDQQINSIQEN